jgi:hypothetical protein
MSFNSGLRRLPLFDEDLYLGMQATSLQVVDHIIRDMESQLLARYIEEERTPGPEAMVVSAFSQLWVLGLYEVLRTWRTRGERILEFAASLEGVSEDARERLIQEKRRKVEKAGEFAGGLVDRWPAFERASKDGTFANLNSCPNPTESACLPAHGVDQRVRLRRGEGIGSSCERNAR